MAHRLDQRHRSIRGTLLLVLVLNLVAAGAKLGVGWLVGSVAMVADGFHSLTDAAATVVGLVGIAVASRPPDETHPYGHRKFETLSALFIGGLLAVTAWEILQTCLHRWRAGEVPEVTPASLAVMVGAIVVSLAVSAYEARQGRRYGSELLLADAAHTRSDVATSVVVLVSLVGAKVGYPRLDLLAAIVVTALIAKAAYEIVRDSVDALADAALVPESRVREVARTVPGVEGVHKVRTRRGFGGGHCDLHVQVRADLRLDRAHVVGHLVADRLKGELGLEDVVVHVEPPDGHQTDWRPEHDSSPPTEG